MFCSLLQFFTPTRRHLFLSIASVLGLVCAALLTAPDAFGVTPAPDGGYSGANTAEGTDALFSLTSGFANTATGYQTLFTTISGQYNTATGYQALYNTGNAFANTATGVQALYTNTTGGDNTATGFTSLYFNTTGIRNTADGSSALTQNTTGNQNTAAGENALYFNTTGDNNTANGAFALAGNINSAPNTGSNNTASGFQALFNNTTGSNNTADGANALNANKTGVGNTASGFQSLLNNKSGLNNTANGRQALQNNMSGSFNIAVGNLAGRNLTTGSNNIDIGNQGIAAEAQTTRIGEQGTQNRTFIAGISGVAVTGPAVHVSSSGQLGIIPSSARFKKVIKPMDKASDAILALNPVTFRYKEEIDPDNIPQFGLIAEEVEKVNPDLVIRGEDGKVMTVRYEAVNAMLLNEFLKEHHRVEEQGVTIAKQQKQIEALTDTVQKVSERVALSAPATQIAATED